LGSNRLYEATTRKQRIRYRYDALGRRISRYIVGGKENTKFTYDGNDVILDDNSGVITKYQNGLGIDNKLKMVTNGVSKYFLQDHLGSTTALTNSSGSVIESATYDSFGNATGNLSTRYQFTGREYDNAIGLTYYRARWYSSELGRFVSEDPIGFAGGDVNLFGYVGNSPQNFVDPSGKYPIILGRFTPITLDEIQTYLAGLGLIPVLGEPADALDGAISLARGEYCDAALSGGSLFPFVGTGAGITKIGKRLSKFVDLTDFRKTHILDRHKFGAGKPGKTEFPANWSDDELLHNVSDIATDPTSIRGVDNFGNWSQPYATGFRNGVEVRVDFFPSNSIHSGKISTAYPINVPRNP
jgi:RHS repeat-associated protein